MATSLLNPSVPERFNQAVFLVDRHVDEGRGAHVAYYYRGGRIRYDELLRRTNRAGNALRSLGLDVEQRVALILPDCPALPSTYLGAMKIGAVPLPLNPLQSAEQIGYCLSDSRARVVVVAEQFLPKVVEALTDAPYLTSVVVVTESPIDLPPGIMDYGRLVRAQPARLEAASTSRDDMAFWMYSSGTTGPPKAVVHLHHDVLFYQPPFAEAALGVSEEDTLFATSKMFFSYGRNASIEMPLLYGASAVLFPERPTPEGVLDAMAAYRPTIFQSVPTFYAALLEHVGQTGGGGELSSLRLAVSSGEALPRPLFERWKDMFHLEIIETLGSTDAGAQYLANYPGAVKPGSAGVLLPTFEAKLVDEEGSEVPQGDVGTLRLKSGGTAPSYWNKHEESKRTFLGEWLDTGDLLRQDSDGYYWYVGRSDDVFKVRGMWLSPPEIEDRLVAHPAVLECAVVDARDEAGLFQAKAFVVLRPAHSADGLAEELLSFLAERLPAYQIPQLWEFVDALPRTATGKVQRFLLRSQV